MILCVDCGNTEIKFAFFDSDEMVSRFSINTSESLSSDDYSIRIKFLSENLANNVKGAIVSSVVPSLTKVLVLAIKKAFGCDVKILNNSLRTKLPIKIDNPKELGSDFLCTAVGALAKYKPPFVIADLGTATKMSVVDKNGNFIGGIITTGMKVSLEGLVKSAAQLYSVEIAAPKKIIGRNSIESIQSGIVFGQAFMVSEFARRMESELGYKLTRILTGGFSSIIKDQISCFCYEKDLSLYGLNIIYGINEGVKKYE